MPTADTPGKPSDGLRRLYYGGSFNPIHHGHLIGSRFVAEQLGYDRVVLIPAARNPHKSSAAEDSVRQPDPHHRLEMCRLAVEGDERFEVSDIEITRSGPSYTIDTVRELTNRAPRQPDASQPSSSKVHWLIGADNLSSLMTWHQASALLAEVHFVVMVRPGVTIPWADLDPALRPLRNHLLPGPEIDISSTDIRRRARTGVSMVYLTTPSVVKMILQKNLYRA